MDLGWLELNRRRSLKKGVQNRGLRGEDWGAMHQEKKGDYWDEQETKGKRLLEGREGGFTGAGGERG